VLRQRAHVDGVLTRRDWLLWLVASLAVGLAGLEQLSGSVLTAGIAYALLGYLVSAALFIAVRVRHPGRPGLGCSSPPRFS